LKLGGNLEFSWYSVNILRYYSNRCIVWFSIPAICPAQANRKFPVQLYAKIQIIFTFQLFKTYLDGKMIQLLLTLFRALFSSLTGEISLLGLRMNLPPVGKLCAWVWKWWSCMPRHNHSSWKNIFAIRMWSLFILNAPKGPVFRWT
jgi:hypothetical protein